MSKAIRQHRNRPTILIGTLLLSLMIAVILGEAVRRVLDGYALNSVALSQRDQALPTGGNVTANELQAVAETMIVPGGPGLELFNDSPPAPADKPITPLLAARAGAAPQSRYHVNFVFNEAFIRGPDAANYIKDDFPEDIFVFTSPDGTSHPRYRHYPASRLTIGYDTNTQGWRSKELELDKPRNTIRLVGLGDSTTLHQGGIEKTYLDFVEHFLQRWADAHGFDVHIETMNTGREAISSEDLKAIFQYEALPYEPDYVLFYGLGNQWNIHELVEFSDDVTGGWSSATSYYQQSALDQLAHQILAPLIPYSASAKWIYDRFQADMTDNGGEPRKPKQTWVFPTNMSETKPDPKDLLANSPNARMVRDLSEIQQLAKENNARVFLQTFKYMVYDGMELPLPQAAGLFNYLNYGYFPYSYKHLRRAIDYLNRIYVAWAAENDVTLIDVAGQMPFDHRYFRDAMHNTQTGVKLRAWSVFQEILPQFKADLESGRLPSADRQSIEKHPFPLIVRTLRKSDILKNR